MFKKIIIAIALITSTFCSVKEIPADRIFDLDKINGKSVSVELDNEFAILLRANPTTGYLWYLADNVLEDEGLAKIDINTNGDTKNFLSLPTNEGRMGLGGSYYFDFIGRRAGTYPLVFVHKRSWEKEAISTRAISVTITERKN